MSDTRSEVMADAVAGRAALGLLCGALLGEGMSRKVFVCGMDPSLVVKVETGGGHFQNICEWNLWQAVQYQPDTAKWLAPCHHISPDGSVLIMARTSPLALHDYPDQVPMWLSDRKFCNFGLYKGNFVAHDYGLHTALTHGTTKRLTNAHWLATDDFEHAAKDKKA